MFYLKAPEVNSITTFIYSFFILLKKYKKTNLIDFLLFVEAKKFQYLCNEIFLIFFSFIH